MHKSGFIFLVFISTFLNAEPNSKIVGAFSSESLVDWEAIVFNSETSYEFVKSGAVSVLQSVSHASASGLVTEQKIDLRKFPYLNWRWQAKKTLAPLNHQTKVGDDYVARIYILVSDGWFFWNTKAMNYVWSSQANKGEIWPNAYAPDNARMMALRTSDDEENIWYQEKRNVFQDLKRWLGKDFEYVEAIAIMTDTDDSSSSASAMYGDIYFSSE